MKAREEVVAALAKGQVLKPLPGFSGKWGCFPMQRGESLLACNDEDVTALVTAGYVERIPNVGYILERNRLKAVEMACEQLTAHRLPVQPYSFSDLIDGKADLRELSTVVHLHIPKAGGGTVHTLLRQNNFTALDFDMESQTFFGTVTETLWSNIQLRPPPRRRFFMTGHFRLDVPLLRAMWVPHVIVTTLRDPIKRVLSHYNFTLLVPDNPYHHELLSGKMSFLDYVEWLAAPGSIGPQYSFFDDTGSGTFARTGTASVEKCLKLLLEKVGVFGFTDRFDEFCVQFGYLLRRPNIAVLGVNETADLNDDDIQLKIEITADERKALAKLYADDIWFFAEARREYERRIADPRIEAVMSAALPLLAQARAAMEATKDVADPENPEHSAFTAPFGPGLRNRRGKD
jgi:hypothetical protein